MSCGICGRPASGDDRFCRYHSTAYENLRTGYGAWNAASKVLWDEYLSMLLDLDEVGTWVKDVIGYLRSQGDREES